MSRSLRKTAAAAWKAATQLRGRDSKHIPPRTIMDSVDQGPDVGHKGYSLLLEGDESTTAFLDVNDVAHEQEQ